MNFEEVLFLVRFLTYLTLKNMYNIEYICTIQINWKLAEFGSFWLQIWLNLFQKYWQPCLPREAAEKGTGFGKVLTFSLSLFVLNPLPFHQNALRLRQEEGRKEEGGRKGQGRQEEHGQRVRRSQRQWVCQRLRPRHAQGGEQRRHRSGRHCGR